MFKERRQESIDIRQLIPIQEKLASVSEFQDLSPCANLLTKWIQQHIEFLSCSIFLIDERHERKVITSQRAERRRNQRMITYCFPLEFEQKARGLLEIQIPEAYELKKYQSDMLLLAARQLSAGISQILYAQRSRIDFKTGFFNSGHFSRILIEEITKCEREQGKCSLIMFDLDDFKSINTKHGELAGDAVLNAVSSSINTGLKNMDVTAYTGRWGGEEFFILLRGQDDNGTRHIAGQLREHIEQIVMPWENTSISVTASFGYVLFPEDSQEIEDLKDKADKATRFAKQSGKNNVKSYTQACILGEEELEIIRREHVQIRTVDQIRESVEKERGAFADIFNLLVKDVEVEILDEHARNAKITVKDTITAIKDIEPSIKRWTIWTDGRIGDIETSGNGDSAIYSIGENLAHVEFTFHQQIKPNEIADVEISYIVENGYVRSSEWHNIVLSYARDPLDLAFTIIFPEGRKCRACQMFYQSQGEEKLYGVQPVLNDQGAKIVFGRSKVEPVDFIVRWEW